MKKAINIAAVVLTGALVCSPLFASAATGAPVDGGLSLLVAAGFGYAAKKVASKKKTTVK